MIQMQLSETIYVQSKPISIRRCWIWKYNEKTFKVSQTAWNNFFKPAVNVVAPFLGMVVGAKSKNAQVGAATTIILESISEGKILSLIDMHGRVLRLNVM